jgi:hypothetical protein
VVLQGGGSAEEVAAAVELSDALIMTEEGGAVEGGTQHGWESATRNAQSRE